MKKTLLTLICIVIAALQSMAVNVTFRVNMSQVSSVSPNGVHIAGSFQTPNQWSPGANPLTDLGNGIWEATFNIPSGTAIQYKFINGNNWGPDESVSGSCGAGNGNRTLTVPNADVVLPAYCFGTCNICPANSPVLTTIQVDMSQQTISPNGVFIAGSFNGWSPNTTSMSSIGGGVYQASILLNAGFTYQYKFINGNTMNDAETVPSSCATSGNRSIVAPSSSSTIPTVCFSRCGACPTAAPVNVTFRVDMANSTVSPNGVRIAGSFNNWSLSTTMSQVGSTSVYEYQTQLLPGDQHEYKFINGNSFNNAESVPGPCNQNGNRYMTVASSNTVLPTVCFGSCNACASGTVAITFQVDMSNQTVGSNVYMAGTFNGWNSTATPMTDNGSGVYQVTLNLAPGTYMEYKFINGTNWENVPGGCATNGNRALTVPSSATTINPICFGSCTICAPPTISVTFRVDMSQQTVSPNGVHIAGSFQGWNPGSTPLTDMGNGIWEYTTTLQGGNSYEYKFINGNSWGSDEAVPSSCAVNGNRGITLGLTNTTLPTVCFGQCSACTSTQIQVTFRVNMSNTTVSPNGVHIAGAFQGWNPGSTPMTAAGNGIYEYTTILTAGQYFEYKFVNGNSWGADESVPSSCANNNNRFITVPSSNTILPAVCYGTCNVCAQSRAITFRVNVSNVNPAPSTVQVSGTFNNWTPQNMTNIGSGIYSVTVQIPEGSQIEYKFVTNGNYETVTGNCTSNNGNRALTVPTSNTTLSNVCLGSCNICNVSVTFRVDMSNTTVSPNGVHIAGNFQNWNPGGTPMTNRGNGVYEYTVSLAPGTQVQYKFINGNSWGSDESVPGACNVGGNRGYTVASSNAILGLVCFGSCSPCVIPSPVIDPSYCGLTDRVPEGPVSINLSTFRNSKEILMIMPVPGASRYLTEFYSDANLSTFVGSTISALTIRLSLVNGITYGATYYTRTTALRNGGQSPWGATCSFSTVSQPNANTVPSTSLIPQDCNRLTQVATQSLTIQQVQGATLYEMAIHLPGTYPGTPVFSNVTRNRVIPISSLIGLTNGVTYEIRCRAYVGSTAGSWGPSCLFSIPSVTPRLENNPSETFSTYPNPFNISTNVRFTGAENEKVNIQVVDVQGRLIESFQSLANVTTQIGETYPNGVYFVKGTTGSMSKTIKIVKSN